MNDSAKRPPPRQRPARKQPGRSRLPSLSRPIHPVPDFVTKALADSGLTEAFRGRPPFQQNDYIGWINRARRPETKQRRLASMLYELERGDLYMKSKYNPRSPRRSGRR